MGLRAALLQSPSTFQQSREYQQRRPRAYTTLLSFFPSLCSWQSLLEADTRGSAVSKRGKGLKDQSCCNIPQPGIRGTGLLTVNPWGRLPGGSSPSSPCLCNEHHFSDQLLLRFLKCINWETYVISVWFSLVAQGDTKYFKLCLISGGNSRFRTEGRIIYYFLSWLLISLLLHDIENNKNSMITLSFKIASVPKRRSCICSHFHSRRRWKHFSQNEEF